MITLDAETSARRAHQIRDALPSGGLFADQHWRMSATPLALGAPLVRELETLGRVLLQFYRAAGLLYRQSVAGQQPAWVAQLLDQGKPDSLIELQRDPALKGDLPRVIRPDCLLTDEGIAITELDSVPGGIGLTAWLNEVYSGLGDPVLGGGRGMFEGFGSIFGDARQVRIVVSQESSGYRPEMEWMAGRMGADRFSVHDASLAGVAPGEAAYRFFELFDLANVPAAPALFDAARRKEIRLTPPPKPIFEEKLLFALLWNRNLRPFWRRELGEGFLNRLLRLVPYTWVVDPAPLPPHGAIPELNLTHWDQLKSLSQRERSLILKVSGYSEEAWGARGVYFGSDLSGADWSAAVDKAVEAFPRSPYVLQRYHKPRTVESAYHDFARDAAVPMPGRVRLCPYYFVEEDGDAGRARLGGVLATICPADKKIIHGMKDAILVPCVE
jgi:hypothetical protein